jgi:hypothetical protein
MSRSRKNSLNDNLVLRWAEAVLGLWSSPRQRMTMEWGAEHKEPKPRTGE